MGLRAINHYWIKGEKIMAENEVVAKVQSRITQLEQGSNGLTLPSDYSLGNALNSAWLMINDDSKLMATSDGSKAQALLNMAIQGLSPAKSQGYFIPYGQKLTFQRSYFGSLTILKRLENVKDVFAEIVHKGDVFEIGADESGRQIVKNFKPDFSNLDNEIVGVFAVITQTDGTKNYTVMTKKMIDQSWSHAKTTKVQKEFPGEMAKRTVLNRAAKFFINTSGDNDMLIKAINDTTADEYDDNRKDVTPENSVASKLENKFNSEKEKSVSDKESSTTDTEPENKTKVIEGENVDDSHEEPEVSEAQEQARKYAKELDKTEPTVEQGELLHRGK